MTDLESGRVRYIHDGSENFHDSIRIIANDNKGVDYRSGSVSGGETFPAGTYVEGDIIPGYWDNGVWVEEQVVGEDGFILLADLIVGGEWVNGSSQVSTDAPANNNGHTIYGPNQSSISEVGTIKVNITPVNDKVIFEKNDGMTVSFGDEAITSVDQFLQNGGNLNDIKITKDMLSWKDDDAFTADEQFDPAQVMYIIQEPPANGSLYVQNSKGEWIPARVGTMFSQSQVNAGQVVYLHFGTERTAATTGGSLANGNGLSQHNESFKFTVYDGDPTKVHTEVNGDLHTFVINVDMANTGPVIENGANAKKDYYLNDTTGIELDRVFTLDDPDYYYGGGTNKGISNDYMQLNIDATKLDGGARWGSFGFKAGYDPASNGIDVIVTSEGKIVMRGNKADLQAALDNLVFKPTDGTNAYNDIYGDIDAKVKLTVTLNDLANGVKGTTQSGVDDTRDYHDNVKGNGLPGALEISKTIEIWVSPKNDKPWFFPDKDNTGDSDVKPDDSNLNSYVVEEDSGAFNVTYSDGKPLYIHDPDHFLRNINEVTITCSLGTLGFNGQVSIMGVSGTLDTATGVYTLFFRGTNEAINDALSKLTYKPRADLTGDNVINISYNDGYDRGSGQTDWGTGEGGVKDCHAKVAVKITPINDEPVLAAPTEPIVVNGENTPTTIVKGADGKFIQVSDPKDDPTKGGFWWTGPEQNFTVTIEALMQDADGNLTNTQWGKLNIGSIPGVTITSGANSGKIVFEGTLENINKALETLSFTPEASTQDTVVVLKINVNDGGNGSAIRGDNDLEANAQVTIIVNDANDAPAIKTGNEFYDPILNPEANKKPAVSLDEDGSLWFDSSKDIGISIKDPDALGYQIEVVLTVDDGKLSFKSGSIRGREYGFTNYDSMVISADGKTITLKASQDKINAALADLVFTPKGDWNGTTILHITSNDFGNTGTGGAKGDTCNITITVDPLNDSPSLNGIVKDKVVNTDAITEDLDPLLNGGKRVDQIFGSYFKDDTDNRYAAAKTVDGNNPHGSKSNAFIGIWVTDVPDNTGKGVWEYWNGTAWDTVKVDMFLRADALVRFQPVLNYNSDTTAGTAGAKGTVAQLTVSLVESKVYHDHGDKSLDTLSDLSTGKIFTDAEKAEGGLLWRDGVARFTETLKLGIRVKAVNDAPEVHYTGAGTDPADRISVAEDTPISITGISFSDIDVNERANTKVTVTLSVKNGTLSLTKTTGITGYSPSGTLILTGSLTDINNAIATLKYQGKADFNGLDDLTVVIKDNGNASELGGTNTSLSSAPKIIYLEVEARNDAPISLNPGLAAESIQEDITSAANTGKTVDHYFKTSFNDDKDAQYHVTDNPDGSKANTFIGIWVKEGQTEQLTKGVWQYRDTTESNPALQWKEITAGMFLSGETEIRFQPVTNYNSEMHDGTGNAKNDAPQLKVGLVESKDGSPLTTGTVYTDAQLTDPGHGPRYSGDVMLSISVTAVNDDPTIDYTAGVPGVSGANRIKVNEQGTVNVGSEISFADVDVNERNGSTVTVTLEVDHGTLNLGTPSGVTFTSGYGNGKSTVIITGTLADINSAIKNLEYTGVNNYNGLDTLKVTISDNHNSNSASTPTLHEGIATRNVHIQVNAVNDAPTSSSSTVVAETIHEDTTDNNAADSDNLGKAVAHYFEGLFLDTADAQHHATDNPDGSQANGFIGVWVKSNQTEQATKGTWKYFDTGVNDWVEITGGMFLSKDTVIRFEPVLHYNSQVHNEFGNAKNDAPQLTVNLVESKDAASSATCDLTTGLVYTAGQLTEVGHGPRYSGDVTLSITVTAVNTAPTIDYNGNGERNPATPNTPSATPIEVGEDLVLEFKDGNKITFADLDNNERTGATVTVTLTVEHGTLSLTGDHSSASNIDHPYRHDHQHQ